MKKDALLHLADCINFGLKRTNKNQEYEYLYEMAARLYQPEAMSVMSSKQLCNLFNKQLITSEKLLYWRRFRDWLQKLAYMKWISIDFLDQINVLLNNELEEVDLINEIFPMSQILMDLKNGRTIDNMNNSNFVDTTKIILCSNQTCNNMIGEDFKKEVYCKRCLKAIFCSHSCKHEFLMHSKFKLCFLFANFFNTLRNLL